MKRIYGICFGLSVEWFACIFHIRSKLIMKQFIWFFFYFLLFLLFIPFLFFFFCFSSAIQWIIDQYLLPLFHYINFMKWFLFCVFSAIKWVDSKLWVLWHFSLPNLAAEWRKRERENKKKSGKRQRDIINLKSTFKLDKCGLFLYKYISK